MTGFEPRTSGIGSDRSTNWATTTALGFFFGIDFSEIRTLIIGVADEHDDLVRVVDPHVCANVVAILSI